MIFNNIISPKTESPSLTDSTTGLFSFTRDRLTVTYTGKLNQSITSCLQCSQPARPFAGTFVYYFEVCIKVINTSRPGLVIGFTEEYFQKTRPPGSSKKSFGLRSDGKLLRDPAQIPDFCPKFEKNDTVGAGICYISQKVFFTRNGILLGKPFDIPEMYPLFASISLNSPNDSVGVNFEGNFVYDLKDLVQEESSKMQSEIENEQYDPRSAFQLIREYLEFQGYSETLMVLDKDLKSGPSEKTLNKNRSYSGRISERYDSVNINPECETCESFGKLCKFCVKKVMENVEPGNMIRLPESRNRCDSVDVCSLYMKSQTDPEPLTPVSPLVIKDVKTRGQLRKLITRGSLNEAFTYLTENFPDMLNDEFCMCYFYVQEFIELIKSGEPVQAMRQAKEKLVKFREFHVFCRDLEDNQIKVSQILGLLAYEQPEKSPLGKLLQQSQLELTADLVNARITQRLRDAKNSLEDLLKHLLAVESIYQSQVLMNKVEKISLKF